MAAPTSAPIFHGVGDTAFAIYNIDADITAGQVVNGTDLRYDATFGPWTSTPAFPPSIGAPLPGAWRALAGLPSATAGSQSATGYFIRVS